MLCNGRFSSDEIRACVYYELKIRIVLCIPNLVQSGGFFDFKDQWHGLWCVSTGQEMPIMEDECQASVGVVDGVSRDVQRGLQLGFDVPCGLSGAGRQNGLIGTRSEVLGAGILWARNPSVPVWPAKAPAGQMRARFLVCLTTCQRRQTTPFRQPDGFGQA